VLQSIFSSTPRQEGTVRDFTALDIVPAGTKQFVNETFHSELRANVHNHKIAEDGNGWIIIDTEETVLIPENTFAATSYLPNCIKIIHSSHALKSAWLLYTLKM
jgi:hypothetical protein